MCDDQDDYPVETPSSSPVPPAWEQQSPPAWEKPPPAPQVTYNWVDITDEFSAACEGLVMGELVREQR